MAGSKKKALRASETLDEGAGDGRSTRHEGRRQEILAAAIDYVFKNGLSDLSIRPMAEALGISHRTLLHHFGSKEEMVERVLAEARTRQLEELKRRTLDEATGPLEMMDAAWQDVSRPERLPFWKAFFEVYALAVKHPERHADFLDSIVKAWLPHIARAVAATGIPAETAMLIATLEQAFLRGLILDLLTTGDRKRVQAAYALARGVVERELKSARAATRK